MKDNIPIKSIVVIEKVWIYIQPENLPVILKINQLCKKKIS